MPNGPVFHVPTSCLDGRGGPPASTPPPPVLCEPRRAVSDHLWNSGTGLPLPVQSEEGNRSHTPTVVLWQEQLSPPTPQLTNCRTNRFKHSKGGRDIQGAEYLF